MSTRLLVAGEITADHYLPGHVPGPDDKIVTAADGVHHGGVGANTAVAAARAGADVSLVARVGGDHLGAQALFALRSQGVSTHLVEVDPDAATLRCLIWTGASGQRSSLLVESHLIFPRMKALVGAVDRAAATGESTWLHLAPFEPEAVMASIAAARRHGMAVSMDLEPAGVLGLGSALRIAVGS